MRARIMRRGWMRARMDALADGWIKPSIDRRAGRLQLRERVPPVGRLPSFMRRVRRVCAFEGTCFSACRGNRHSRLRSFVFCFRGAGAGCLGTIVKNSFLDGLFELKPIGQKLPDSKWHLAVADGAARFSFAASSAMGTILM